VSAPAGRAQASHTGQIVTEADLSWQQRARCTGVDPELFFPTKGRSGGEAGRSAIPATRICVRCDVQLQCLQYALSHPDGKHGIWGGATEDERHAIRTGRIAS
jgi:WhiB family redox-sensing transcriptional regulator